MVENVSFPEMYPIGTLQTPGTPVFPFEVILECRLARAEDGTSMFVILWEFEVKPGSEERFQRVYGPQGAWARLFQRDPHFRGTQLQRDPSRPLYYFTIDFWDSETAYKNFLEANRAAYDELDGSGEQLTLQERHILSFTLD
jgi:heme-degrading monooxygenase HmoA